MLKTPLGQVRLLGMIEGASFLLLLFVAMPIKYIGGDPSWVRWVGMAHGVLFVFFVMSLGRLYMEEDWPLGMLAKPFLASLVPFGPFYIDRRLKEYGDSRASSPEA